MFVGHAALALAARAKAPSVSLGWLFAASFGLDLLWPILLLAGLERVSITPGATPFTPLTFDAYPWSHSLLMAIVWALLAVALARWRRVPASAAALVGALVLSHWLLDLLTHAPDLPLWPGPGPRVGLGLWQSVPATLIVEGALYAAGIAAYVHATRPVDRIGRFAFWSLLIVCAAMWASGPFSPPPPSARLVAWGTFGVYLLVLWAGWADSHRVLRTALA